MVVDDDLGVRRLTARILRAAGYHVLEAASGAEALRLLSGEPGIRLVVTDIVMPEMHGLDLADRALARTPDLRVVLIADDRERQRRPSSVAHRERVRRRCGIGVLGSVVAAWSACRSITRSIHIRMATGSSSCNAAT